MIKYFHLKITVSYYFTAAKSYLVCQPAFQGMIYPKSELFCGMVQLSVTKGLSVMGRKYQSLVIPFSKTKMASFVGIVKELKWRVVHKDLPVLFFRKST